MTLQRIPLPPWAPSTPPSPGQAPSRRRRGFIRRHRSVLLSIAVVMALLLAVPVWSFARAMTAPGHAGWQSRSIEWIRDHGGSPVVDRAENWWYARQGPVPGAAFSGPLPSLRSGAQVAAGIPRPGALPLLQGNPALPGEAVWQPDPRRVGGEPVLYTAFFRIDPRYPSVVVGAAWLPRAVTDTHLIAGTDQPGGAGWPEQARVPVAQRSTLVAAFNSGYKLQDAEGGYYADGRVAEPLVAGAASLVIFEDGAATVGAWQRDVSFAPNVAAVRQNLHLLVDGGAVVPGIAGNSHDYWGKRGQQFQYTWRSGIGVDARGNLIYVAADKINLAMLAQAMVDAGMVRGMQLDMHHGMVTFNVFNQVATGSNQLNAAKLLPTMTEPATRYLVPDQRDFFAVGFRSAPRHPSGGP